MKNSEKWVLSLSEVPVMDCVKSSDGKSFGVYYELFLKINPEMADVISEICFENLPCEGVILAEEEYKDLEMVSTTEGTLKIFLTDRVDVKSVLSDQRDLLKSRGFSDADLGSWEYSFEEKENQDWSQKWKEKWDVTHVSDKITVVPDWIEYAPKAKDEVIIKLEPGCAFGTGTHATTQLCMLAIEKYLKKQDVVADIGMGSGILAICAKKFGARYVYGCDNDETVIDVAKENAHKNGVECKFELNTADKISEKFDFVLANILHNVLAEIMPDLKNIMKDGGILVLSGILDEKKQVVLDAIKKCGLILVEENHMSQWTSFIVRRGK